MKNSILFFIKGKIDINVKGNNIQRFIKRLKNHSIEIINIKHLSADAANIRIFKEDYESVIKLKTIYDINIINYYGLSKFKNKIFNNKYIIIFIFISFIFLYILTNIIFEIDVITNDSKMKDTLLIELKELGITKYKFKKNYNNLQDIKHKILSNHKDEIEWIEIENIGTKYIIRYEPRVKNIRKSEANFRNIIAKKNSIIKKMDISSGQIVKNINSYVKKGDVIVSGYIDLNGNIKDTVSSTGTIYGEVWYKVEVTYPYKYNEIKETGNTNRVLVIKILNKEIELFNFNRYKTKKKKDNTLLKNNLLPIKLIYQLQKETNIINENNTDKEIIEKAIKCAKKRLKERLKEKEYISDYKVLNKTKRKNDITLNIFFIVIEDITEYQTINKYEENIE